MQDPPSAEAEKKECEARRFTFAFGACMGTAYAKEKLCEARGLVYWDAACRDPATFEHAAREEPAEDADCADPVAFEHAARNARPSAEEKKLACARQGLVYDFGVCMEPEYAQETRRIASCEAQGFAYLEGVCLGEDDFKTRLCAARGLAYAHGVCVWPKAPAPVSVGAPTPSVSGAPDQDRHTAPPPVPKYATFPEASTVWSKGWIGLLALLGVFALYTIRGRWRQRAGDQSVFDWIITHDWAKHWRWLLGGVAACFVGFALLNGGDWTTLSLGLLLALAVAPSWARLWRWLRENPTAKVAPLPYTRQQVVIAGMGLLCVVGGLVLVAAEKHRGEAAAVAEMKRQKDLVAHAVSEKLSYYLKNVAHERLLALADSNHDREGQEAHTADLKRGDFTFRQSREVQAKIANNPKQRDHVGLVPKTPTQEGSAMIEAKRLSLRYAEDHPICQALKDEKMLSDDGGQKKQCIFLRVDLQLHTPFDDTKDVFNYIVCDESHAPINTQKPQRHIFRYVSSLKLPLMRMSTPEQFTAPVR